MVRRIPERLTLVVDPRFSGGTSSAVAREIHALARVCDVSVVAISSALFKGSQVHPAIEAACDATQTPLVWDPAIVSSDLIALHNPSFLKFNTTLATRFICDRMFVVCHENFLRPDGPESFDVAHCLDLIADATLARRKYLSPISGWNRDCAARWVAQSGSNWPLAPSDWTNICDFAHRSPTDQPTDRRGRHSRPGIEKFPPMPDMLQSFPQHCDAVRILGADTLIGDDAPAHWDLLPFGAEDVDAFLASIDFFVYFTHPFLQESFGRVIGEAIAAGKVVITSAATGATFSDGVVTAQPEDVNGIVTRMIAEPALYQKQVRRGQKILREFDAQAFVKRFCQLIHDTKATHQHSQREAIYDLL